MENFLHTEELSISKFLVQNIHLAGDLSGALTYGRLKDSRTLAGTKFENKSGGEYGAYLEQNILLLD